MLQFKHWFTLAGIEDFNLIEKKSKSNEEKTEDNSNSKTHPPVAGQNESAGAGLGVYSMDRMVGDEGPFPHATPSGPYFDPEFSRNISVISGGKAVLNCRVYNIGNRTVSG